jgi:hypothetical protein
VLLVRRRGDAPLSKRKTRKTLARIRGGKFCVLPAMVVGERGGARQAFGMLALWVSAWVTAAPVQLAQPEMRGANVPKDSLVFFGEHLALQLRAAGLAVVTQREIATLLGVERQRALLGCDDQGACVAELASALGAEGVLIGDVGHFSEVFQVNLKVLSGRDASVLASFSERVGTEKAVLEALERGARALSLEVHRRLGRPLPFDVAEPPTVRSRAWIPAVAGGVLAVGGSVLLVLAGADYATLTTPGGTSLSPTEATATASGGALKRNLGVAAVGVGGAALVTSLVMAIAGGGQAPLAVVPAGQGVGAAVVFSGRWP